MPATHNIFRWIVAINLAVVLLCYWNRNNLPDHLVEEVFITPQITATTEPPFLAHAKEQVFSVEPKATYKINALVLNRHVGTKVIAASVDKDFRLADLCLTWGKNLGNGSYKEIKMQGYFCSYQYQGSTGFDPDSYSLNMLLTDNKKIARQINSINIGEQVSIEGYLVDYSVPGQKSFFPSHAFFGDSRNEAVYVTNITRLRSNPWRVVLHISLLCLVLVLVLWSDMETHWHNKFTQQK